MRTVLKWIGYALGGVATLAVMAAAFIYVQSEQILHRRYNLSLAAFTAAADSADSSSVANGERLARISGCMGCHGANLEGTLFFDEPGVAKLYAPNLTRAIREYSDAEFERLMRRGVRRNGESVFAMPSDMFRHRNDEELRDILAYVRTRPVTDGPVETLIPGPMGRFGLVTKEFPPMVDQIAEAAGQEPPAARDSLGAAGRYLALTACTECHGPALAGGAMGPDRSTPSLMVVASYTPEQFANFLKTGVARDGTERPLMSDVAKGRFSHFTPDEVGALYAYLRTLGSAMP